MPKSRRLIVLALLGASMVLLIPGLLLPVLSIRGVLTRDGIAHVAPMLLNFDLHFGLPARRAFREPVAGRDLVLVGAGSGILEVLALVDEAGDADHGEARDQGKCDREADRQPVGQRMAQPEAPPRICLAR